MVKRGRRPTHRWAKWLGKRGTVTRLIRGVDYHCTPHGFAQEARKVAGKLRVSLSVYITEESGISIVTLTNKGPLKCQPAKPI